MRNTARFLTTPRHAQIQKAKRQEKENAGADVVRGADGENDAGSDSSEGGESDAGGEEDDFDLTVRRSVHVCSALFLTVFALTLLRNRGRPSPIRMTNRRSACIQVLRCVNGA